MTMATGGTDVGPEEEGKNAAWKDYQTVFTNAKAGMEGVDKEKVKRIVFEMSKGSAHFENEQRKQAQVDAKIERLKSQAAKLTMQQRDQKTKIADEKIAALEIRRDLTCTWMHVDMDAFFASVEEQDNPVLVSPAPCPYGSGGYGNDLHCQLSRT